MGVIDAVPPANVDGGLPGAPWHRGRALPEGVHCGQGEGREGDSDDGWTLLESQRQKGEIPEEPAQHKAWGTADGQLRTCAGTPLHALSGSLPDTNFSAVHWFVAIVTVLS